MRTPSRQWGCIWHAVVCPAPCLLHSFGFLGSARVPGLLRACVCSPCLSLLSLLLSQGWGATQRSKTRLLGIHSGVTSLEISSAHSQKLNMHFPHDSTIPLLGFYPRKIKTYFLSINIHSTFIHSCPKLETTYMSVNRWMDKNSRYDEHYSATKRNKPNIHNPVAEPQRSYAKWRRPDTKGSLLCGFICTHSGKGQTRGTKIRPGDAKV